MMIIKVFDISHLFLVLELLSAYKRKALLRLKHVKTKTMFSIEI